MLTAIVGANWGDEGKGRMVDLLAEKHDIVVRYQGGNNAGHTVKNPLGKFVLNLLPCGIFRPEVVNVMGPGMVIDLAHLCGEIQRLKDRGVAVTPDNLKISNRAVICMPYHVAQDGLEEDRLGDAKYGSTRRGIGPVYGDKYMKKCLRMGDLFELDKLEDRLRGIIEWKDLTIHGIYGAAHISYDETLAWLTEYGQKLAEYICDTGVFLSNAAAAGKDILFEAQLGALRDIDYGIYPYTSSSSTLAAYAPLGAGIPGAKLTKTTAVTKAYSTCVGEGPFVCEAFGQWADNLREAGGEYGAATGRPRRIGPFDVVATRYGAKMQGADDIALTMLDVLSYLDEIPVCTAYEIDGEIIEDFPYGEILYRAKPVIKTLPGWKCDITGCRDKKDLPAAAASYVSFIEKSIGCKIASVSVGPERDAFFLW